MAEHEALFFAAVVLDALHHIHDHEVVFRDLKPENVLIDRRGYARVVDFGFAKVLPPTQMTYTILGTPEYLSPDCVLGQGYRFDVDLWAFGVLVYEMLRGRSPFCPPNPDDTMAVFRLITAAKVKIPLSMNAHVANLITNVLLRDRTKRLGDRNGAADVKAHVAFGFLEGDWEGAAARVRSTPPSPSARAHRDPTAAGLRRKDYQAPHVPDLESDVDASKFDTYPEDLAVTPYEGDQAAFVEFGSDMVRDPDLNCA